MDRIKKTLLSNRTAFILPANTIIGLNCLESRAINTMSCCSHILLTSFSHSLPVHWTAEWKLGLELIRRHVQKNKYPKEINSHLNLWTMTLVKKMIRKKINRRAISFFIHFCKRLKSFYSETRKQEMVIQRKLFLSGINKLDVVSLTSSSSIICRIRHSVCRRDNEKLI